MNVEPLIIEDEKPAARRLGRMLEKLGLKPAVMLHSVEESLQWFQHHPQPDLIFLDIQLSDGLSFEIFEAFPLKSAVIFTTAYDEYALRAFKLNSIDYLLKPIDPDELAVAVKKYRERISGNPVFPDFEAVKNMLVNPLERSYKKRYTVTIGQRLRMIPVAEIACFYSEDKGTYIRTVSGRSYPLDSTLEVLEDELSPEIFFRVNRSYIVNLHAIDDMVAYSNSRFRIRIVRFDSADIIVARERAKAFKTWLG